MPAQTGGARGPVRAVDDPDERATSHAGTIVGTLAANRTDLGARSVALLQSGLAGAGDYLEIDFGGRQATPPPCPGVPRATRR